MPKHALLAAALLVLAAFAGLFVPAVKVDHEIAVSYPVTLTESKTVTATVTRTEFVSVTAISNTNTKSYSPDRLRFKGNLNLTYQSHPVQGGECLGEITWLSAAFVVENPTEFDVTNVRIEVRVWTKLSRPYGPSTGPPDYRIDVDVDLIRSKEGRVVETPRYYPKPALAATCTLYPFGKYPQLNMNFEYVIVSYVTPTRIVSLSTYVITQTSTTRSTTQNLESMSVVIGNNGAVTILVGVILLAVAIYLRDRRRRRPTSGETTNRTTETKVEQLELSPGGRKSSTMLRYVEYLAKLEDLKTRRQISEETYLKLKKEFWNKLEHGTG